MIFIVSWNCINLIYTIAVTIPTVPNTGVALKTTCITYANTSVLERYIIVGLFRKNEIRGQVCIIATNV